MRTAILCLGLLLASTAARADLRILATDDVVLLFDGTEIRGTVVAVGLRAVVMIVDDKEKVIPREQVQKITRGEVQPAVKGYLTEAVEGLKRITGPGEASRSAAATQKGEEPALEPAAGKPAAGPVISKQKLEQLMKNNPMVARIVKMQGGPEKAVEWLDKNRSNPEVQRMLDDFLKTGKMPSGLPPGSPQKKRR